MKAIFNGLIVTPNRILTGNVLLYDENVCEIRNRKGLHLGRATELINAEGGFVVPGFINEHIHGLGGVDTMMTTRPWRRCSSCSPRRASRRSCRRR